MAKPIDLKSSSLQDTLPNLTSEPVIETVADTSVQSANESTKETNPAFFVKEDAPAEVEKVLTPFEQLQGSIDSHKKLGEHSEAGELSKILTKLGELKHFFSNTDQAVRNYISAIFGLDKVIK